MNRQRRQLKISSQVHSDVELDRALVNAKDIFDVIPQAVDLIRCMRLPNRSPQEGMGDDVAAANNDETANLKSKDKPIRGVPMFVTLQPIPKKLRTVGLDQTDLAIFEPKRLIIDEALAVFSRLEDLRNRFATLIESVMTYKRITPKLAERALASANAFSQDHLRLLRILGQFIRDIRNGDEEMTEATNFDSINSAITMSSKQYDDHDASESCKDSQSNPSILDKAMEFYDTHSTAVDTADLHPSKFPLVCLEKSFKDFENLVCDIRRVPSGQLNADGGLSPTCFNTIDDVRRAPLRQIAIPLFLMTPSLDDPDATLAVVRFRALLNNRKTYHRRYLVYLEDSSDTSLLPHKEFLKLSEPAYFLGKVDADGNLTWTRDGSDTQPEEETLEASPQLPLFVPSRRQSKVVYHHAKYVSLGYAP